jgi:hypothetical protein
VFRRFKRRPSYEPALQTFATEGTFIQTLLNPFRTVRALLQTRHPDRRFNVLTAEAAKYRFLSYLLPTMRAFASHPTTSTDFAYIVGKETFCAM